MSGTSIFRNGTCLIEGYGTDLDKLNQFDRIGLIKTSEVSRLHSGIYMKLCLVNITTFQAKTS